MNIQCMTITMQNSRIPTRAYVNKLESDLLDIASLIENNLANNIEPNELHIEIMAFLINELNKYRIDDQAESPQYWYSRQGR